MADSTPELRVDELVQQVETLFTHCRELADWLKHGARTPDAMTDVTTDQDSQFRSLDAIRASA